ncbi:hypothetical protein B0J14DRAFT_597873, partial [Halenospora varia]
MSPPLSDPGWDHPYHPIDARLFPSFSLLPTEIRQQIWQYTIQPRVVKLDCHLLHSYSHRVWSDKDIYDYYDDDFFTERTCCWPGDECSHKSALSPRFGFKSQSLVSELYVCRESRAVVLPSYTTAFWSRSTESVWFNFQLDTLYVDWQCAGHPDVLWPVKELGDDIAKVEKLAIWHAKPAQLDTIMLENGEGWAYRSQFPGFYSGDFELKLERFLIHFSNVKTVTLVHRQHTLESDELKDLVELNGMYEIQHSLKTFNRATKYYYNDMERDRLDEEQDSLANARQQSEIDLDIMFIVGRWIMPELDYKLPHPEIERKTITTRKRWLEYQKAKKRYDKRRDLFECMFPKPSATEEDCMVPFRLQDLAAVPKVPGRL